MTKAEQKTAATEQGAAEFQRSSAGGRRAVRIAVLLLYAAAGWALLALLWFGLIS